MTMPGSRMHKQSIQALSKPFLNEVLSEMTHLQGILLPLLAQHCPTQGCIRCLGINESSHNSDADEIDICEQARFLQQYMACATATIYRLNHASQGQHSKTIQTEFEALDALFQTIKMQLLELQPISQEHSGQLKVHVSSMLALLQDTTIEDDGDALRLIETHFS